MVIFKKLNISHHSYLSKTRTFSLFFLIGHVTFGALIQLGQGENWLYGLQRLRAITSVSQWVIIGLAFLDLEVMPIFYMQSVF